MINLAPAKPTHHADDWSHANEILREKIGVGTSTFGTGYTYNEPYAVFYGTYGANGYEVWSTDGGKLKSILFHIIIGKRPEAIE